MAAPNPKPTRPRKSEAEIQADTQRLLNDPAMKKLIADARASRDRGQSERLEDFVKTLDG